MPTLLAPIARTHRMFQTEVGMTTRWALDAKKRELLGDFKAVGREFEPKGRSVEVRPHDFKDNQLGRAIRYGVYDLIADEGWVGVGVTRNTAQSTRAQPLETREVIINLIAGTITSAG